MRTLRQFPTSTTKLVRNTPSGVGADSSCPYPNITKYVHSCHHTRISTLSNMCFHIIKYVFSSHHAHIFALPYQYIRFLLSIIEYKTTQYSIYIHVNCINCFLGYFLIKMQNRPLHSTLYICMHPNFVLASDRNCVPIILPIPSVEPRFISPLYRFHTQNGGGKTRAHRIFTPRNCTKLCADRIICSHASHSIRTPFIEITLHSLRICTLYS